MATNPYALPAGSRILVTGANGYIGSHVVDKLLGMGYRVRGSVRAPKPWLDEYFEQKYGQDVFESVLAGALDDKNVLEQIMDGVDGVIHLVGTYSSFCRWKSSHSRRCQATDLSFRGDPNAVIPWVVKASLNILEIAAQKPSIQRVVLVSSSGATCNMLPDPNGRQIDICECANNNHHF